ncbi:MAG: nucleoside-diphosphate kinase [Peptococcaceae bacterium]
MERTFVMIKPDGVQRNLVGEIISRLEKKGLKIVGLKMLKISLNLAEQHYEEHKERPFFPKLVEFITSDPVVAMVVEGTKAVSTVREMMGATNPLEAIPGTIRATYGMYTERNVIHGSDSLASAQKEINLFFRPEEILN